MKMDDLQCAIAKCVQNINMKRSSFSIAPKFPLENCNRQIMELVLTSVSDVEHGLGFLRPPAVGRRDGAGVFSLVRLDHAREGKTTGDNAAGVASAAATLPFHRRPARSEVTLDDAIEL